MDQRGDKTRFATVTDEEIGTLVGACDSRSTKHSTVTAMNCLRDFCVGNAFDSHFETISKAELCNLLRKFYCCARTKDGELYKRNTMNCIKFGIARYMKQTNGYDIVNDPEFSAANEAFRGQSVNLKKQGKAAIDHHSEIEPEDLKKLYECITSDMDTPRGLQRKVWVDVMMFMINTFCIGRDLSGRRYVFQVLDEMDKNHRADNQDPSGSVGDGRMYEQPGEP